MMKCGPEGASWCGDAVLWCVDEVRARGGELV
jgi:hypothetical protein